MVEDSQSVGECTKYWFTEIRVYLLPTIIVRSRSISPIFLHTDIENLLLSPSSPLPQNLARQLVSPLLLRSTRKGSSKLRPVKGYESLKSALTRGAPQGRWSKVKSVVFFLEDL